jgi:hypothetical protein
MTTFPSSSRVCRATRCARASVCPLSSRCTPIAIFTLPSDSALITANTGQTSLGASYMLSQAAIYCSADIVQRRTARCIPCRQHTTCAKRSTRTKLCEEETERAGVHSEEMGRCIYRLPGGQAVRFVQVQVDKAYDRQASGSRHACCVYVSGSSDRCSDTLLPRVSS